MTVEPAVKMTEQEYLTYERHADACTLALSEVYDKVDFELVKEERS